MDGPGCKKVSPSHLYTAVTLNRAKSDFLKLQDFMHTVYFAVTLTH